MNNRSGFTRTRRGSSCGTGRFASWRTALCASFCASLCASIFALCLASCARYEAAPYIVSAPQQIIGEREGYFALAGVVFDLWNAARKDISSVTVSFLVYDSETDANPLNGPNLVTARFNGIVPAGSSESFAVSLDARLFTIPAKPYRLDFFTIPRIEYTDGSAWEDPFCAHYTRSY